MANKRGPKPIFIDGKPVKFIVLVSQEVATKLKDLAYARREQVAKTHRYLLTKAVNNEGT